MLRNKWQYPQEGENAVQQLSETTTVRHVRTGRRIPVHAVVPAIFMAGALILVALESGRVHNAPVRIVVGLIVSAFGSGYNITSAIFPPGSLKSHEQFGMAMTLSFAVIIVAILVMSKLHVPVSALRLSLPIAAVTVAAGTTGLVRDLVFRRGLPRESGQPSLVTVLAVILTVGVSLATFAIVRPTLTQISPAFFVTNTANQQNGYPAAVIVNSRHLFRLHLAQIAPGQRFQLVIRENSHLYKRESIVSRQRQWAAVLHLPTGSLGAKKLTISLYHTQTRRPFRQLWLYYTVIPKPGPNPPGPKIS